MREIKFTYNWNNKLLTNCFTTVRLKNTAKYIIGDTYLIIFGDESFEADCVDVRHFFLSECNNFISMLDSGYYIKDFVAIVKRMYPTINFDTQQLSAILLKRCQPHKITKFLNLDL